MGQKQSMARRRRRLSAIVATLSCAVFAAACSSSGGSGGPTSQPAAPGGSSGAAGTSGGASTSASQGALAAAGCPNPLIIQSSWYPEVEHGFGYALIGPNGKTNTSTGAYYGTVGGVTVEMRSGGPYLGNEDPVGAMYLHSNIFMAQASTDDAYLESGKFPTVAVFAPLQKSPFSLIYDPRHYHFTNLSQLASSGATILTEGQNGHTAILIADGDAKASQFDYAWDGSPGKFVVAGGKDVMFTYFEDEGYNMEHLAAFGHPLDHLLQADFGYTSYENAVVVRPENVTKYATCLKALVPMIQRAQANFIKNPGPMLTAIYNSAKAQKNPAIETVAHEQYIVATFKKDGLYANGADGVLGSLDVNRVQKFIDTLGPVAKQENAKVKSGITAAQMVTDQFLDKSVHL